MTAFPSLTDHEFVRLTTFRRNGTPVATPMWFVHDGDRLLLSTPAGAAKLKRLRHTARVQVQACARRGEPVPGAPVDEGRCRVVSTDAERRAVEAALADRYGWQWKVALVMERLVGVVRRSGPVKPRVALVIEPAPTAPDA